MGILLSTYQRTNIIDVPFPTKDKHIQQLEQTMLAMYSSTPASLFAVLGVEESPTTKSHSDLDTGQIRKSVWDKTNTEKCLEGRQLTKRDNIKNFPYRRGMAAGPQVNHPEEENSDPTKNKSIAQSIFACCDKKGHKTTRSKLCLFTLVLTSPFYRPNNVERYTGKSPVHFCTMVFV
jgi:hypothetical protein